MVLFWLLRSPAAACHLRVVVASIIMRRRQRIIPRCCVYYRCSSAGSGIDLMGHHRHHSSSSSSSTLPPKHEERLFPDEHSAIIRVERANMVNLMMMKTTKDVTTTPDLLILTHSHQVSDAVLRQQLNLLYKDDKAIPTIALELTRSLTASCLDKFYMIMSRFLQTSSDYNPTRSYTMTGLPKSGKSSLAIIAARRRRLAVKRPVGGSQSRYGYSLMLPKDTAQWQKYVLETQTKLPDMRPMDLWDPPSTVQSDVLSVAEPLRTILQAAGCLPATPTGYAFKLWSDNQNNNNHHHAPPVAPPVAPENKDHNHEMVQLQILLDALHRHANRSGLRRPFDGTITTAAAFWDHVQEEMVAVQRQEEHRRAQNERYNRKMKKNKDGEEILSNVITTVPQLLRACREGQYGPLLFGDDDDGIINGTTNNEDDVLDYHTKFGYVAQRHNTSLHRGDAVVGINGAALALLTSAMANTFTTTTTPKTTTTKTTASPNKTKVSSPMEENAFEAATTMSIVETKEDIAAAPAEEPTAAAAGAAVEPPPESPAEMLPEQPAPPFVRPRKGKKEKVVDTMDQVPIVRFPLHRRTFACMVCAGFVKRGVGQLVYGCGHTKVMSQKYEIIIAYYSRMMEAFGETRRIKYLMKDSLACTLARKHKLISRASAYKKFHGMKEFPMPNRLRPIFLRSDKPIPFVPYCSRLGIKGKKSCYDTIAGKLLDTIPNYEARANVIAEKHQQLLDDLDEEEDNDDSDGDDD